MNAIHYTCKDSAVRDYDGDKGKDNGMFYYNSQCSEVTDWQSESRFSITHLQKLPCCSLKLFMTKYGTNNILVQRES